MRDWLEDRQIPLYLLALLAGAGFGLLAPVSATGLEPVINPVLMLLLYATFLSIPLTRLGQVIRDGRFLAGLMVLNFVIVPVVVFALSRFVADHPALLLGVLFVLLTPCIDYVIVFSGLAGAAHERLAAAAPLLMLGQMLMLPVYLGLFIGPELFDVVDIGPFVEAFVLLIVVPLILAAVTQFLAGRTRLAQRVMRGVETLMVPLVMLTLAVVVASLKSTRRSRRTQTSCCGSSRCIIFLIVTDSAWDAHRPNLPTRRRHDSSHRIFWSDA